MRVDQRLIDTAVDLLNRRFPNAHGVAAALYTEDGSIYKSVVFEPDWGGGGLCAETGAILMAHTDDKRVTACACVARDDAGRILVLAPCGICQERLVHWGRDVEVAVPHPDDPTQWIAKPLRETNPYYWATVFDEYIDERKDKRED